MPQSENGWAVITSQSDPKLTVIKIPHTTIPLRLHKDVAPLLAHVASRVNKEVCSLSFGNKPGVQDEGGYCYRKIDNSIRFSNHASGTAIDLNWSRWPQLRKRMNKKERAACEAIALELQEVIRWGGNYRASRVDEQHWEIAPGVKASQVKAFCQRLGIKPNGTI